MNRRIHEVLDGERDRGELTPAERSRLEEYERAVEGALEPLRRERVPDVTRSVMERIEQAGARAAPGARAGASTGETATAVGDSVLDAVRAGWDWLWRPREIRVRPALAGAAALALVVGLVLTDSPRSPFVVEGPVASAAGGSAPTVMVQFRLDAEDASRVQLAGDFTGWEPAYDMHQVAPGVWSVVVPLAPGVHDYAFVVDGEQWRPDPMAPAVDDGFGGTNSRLALLAPEPGGAS